MLTSHNNALYALVEMIADSHVFAIVTELSEARTKDALRAILERVKDVQTVLCELAAYARYIVTCSNEVLAYLCPKYPAFHAGRGEEIAYNIRVATNHMIYFASTIALNIDRGTIAELRELALPARLVRCCEAPPDYATDPMQKDRSAEVFALFGTAHRAIFGQHDRLDNAWNNMSNMREFAYELIDAQAQVEIALETGDVVPDRCTELVRSAERVAFSNTRLEAGAHKTFDTTLAACDWMCAWLCDFSPIMTIDESPLLFTHVNTRASYNTPDVLVEKFAAECSIGLALAPAPPRARSYADAAKAKPDLPSDKARAYASSARDRANSVRIKPTRRVTFEETPFVCVSV
jgi:hypothetical protein